MEHVLDIYDSMKLYVSYAACGVGACELGLFVYFWSTSCTDWWDQSL